jgi:hypothetical protein
VQVDAVLGVDVAVEGTELGTEDAFERHGLRLDQRDLRPALARRGGDLAADPPGADHDEPATAVQDAAQRVGVLERAQDVDALEL